MSSTLQNMSKYTFRGKHGDSRDIDSGQGSLTSLMRLRDVENTVFDFTSDARLSKCKQQKRITAKFRERNDTLVQNFIPQLTARSVLYFQRAHSLAWNS